MSFDIAVIGAGIVGLAHALAAARRGKSVVVLDRDAQANGASVRNFGFVTVTGQQAGECWRRARRSRDIWAEIAPQANINVVHAGLAMTARRPEAAAVLEAFAATEMGEQCRLISAGEARQSIPNLRNGALSTVLWSPHELRVESKDAIPKLAAWLEEVHGVEFRRSTLVKAVEPPMIETTGGTVHADAAVICPGDDFLTLVPERFVSYGLTKCLLHMMRVRPAQDMRLRAAVMSDLGLVRYQGYAELPEAKALRRVLEAEQGEALAQGVHLIAVQSADGSLVIGDSHLYADTPPPFAADRVDQLILDELDAVLELPGRTVIERWTGTYASAGDRLMLVDRVSETVRAVLITSGTGASTAFAIGEEVMDDLLG
jgi:FAD dependent oxidoreductase TIGR03364